MKLFMLDVFYLSEHSEGFTVPESLFYLLITLSGDRSDPTTLSCVWNVHYTHIGHRFYDCPSSGRWADMDTLNDGRSHLNSS